MQPEIISFQPQYKNNFITLNRSWIEEYFVLEQHDIEVFESLEELILKPGGEIFFCRIDNQIVGTVAMQKVNETTFELAKLAVDKQFQGKKLSTLLVQTCIDFAIQNNAKTIMLNSSTKLDIALNLYRKFNFREVPMLENDYNRTDIQMELTL
jgi:predicted N-acetyltransferase YhbS